MVAWLKSPPIVKIPSGSVVCRSLMEQSTFRASLVFALGRVYTAVMIMAVNSLGK